MFHTDPVTHTLLGAENIQEHCKIVTLQHEFCYNHIQKENWHLFSESRCSKRDVLDKVRRSKYHQKPGNMKQKEFQKPTRNSSRVSTFIHFYKFEGNLLSGHTFSELTKYKLTHYYRSVDSGCER